MVLIDIEFNRIFRGYDPKKVDEAIDWFIAEGAEKDRQIEKFNEKFERLSDSLKELEEQRVAERLQIADVMAVARKDAKEVMDQAHGDAFVILEEARQDIARMTADAQRILETARKEADALTAAANHQSMLILSQAQRDADAVYNQIYNEFAQAETKMREIINYSKYAGEQLKEKFSNIEERSLYALDSIRPMLPQKVAVIEENPVIQKRPSIIIDSGIR
jgi:cell division septum initiation protein DivIVA